MIPAGSQPASPGVSQAVYQAVIQGVLSRAFRAAFWPTGRGEFETEFPPEILLPFPARLPVAALARRVAAKRRSSPAI